MSVLEDLIKKHCPDGVEYIPIGSLMERIKEKGKDNLNIKQVYVVSNMKGIVRSEDYHDNSIHSDDTSNYTILKQDMFAYNPSRLNIGSIGRLKNTISGLVSPMYVVFSVDKSLVDVKYFEYFIKSPKIINKIDSLKEEGARFRFDYNRWNWINIPLPPIEVQKEIVRILDTFTEYQDCINEELTLRKKQYEYYRDKLLTFGDDIEWKELKKVCTDFIVPMRDKPKIFNGNIPWCRIEDVEGKYFNTSLSGRFVSNEVIKEMNLKVFPIGTVICSCSASLGTYAINTQPLITNQTFIGIVCGDKLNNQYLRYYMETQTKKLISLSNAGTIPYISRQKFEDLKIPVPPLEEQERIVKILDRFDALCNDISLGLPAEIELRKKQYEYYRDKLLTFKEKKV